MRSALIQAYYLREGIDAMAVWRSYEDRQQMTPEKFRGYCEGLFLRVLERAASECDYYRGVGCTASPDTYQPLRKRTIVDNYTALTVPIWKDNGCFKGATSGTTGSVVEVWVDKLERAQRLGAAWRGDGFPAIPGGAPFLPWSRTAMLWGNTRIVKGWWQSLSGPLFECLFQKRILDCFHLDSARIRANYDGVARMRPRRIVGYVAALASVARFGLEQGWAPLEVEKVVPTAEQLDERSSELIAGLFLGPQRQRYGCREAGDIAAQCEYGTWHLYSDFLYPEVLLADGSIANEGTGMLLLTKLHNRVMPLIRYEIEDQVTLGGPPCQCGRPMPVMRSIDGRYIDQLVCSDGRRVNGLAVPRVLRGTPYYEFQAVQERAGHCVLSLVPQSHYQPQHGELIRRNWLQFIGSGITFDLVLVDSIPRTSAGKRRQVVSRVQPE